MSLNSTSIICTNYRYEVPDIRGRDFLRNRNQLLDCLEEERRILEGEVEVEEVNQVLYKREWQIGAAIMADRRMRNRNRRLCLKEMEMENKCNVMVRRAALRHQLQHEYDEYQRELKMQDKAFYQQRT